MKKMKKVFFIFIFILSLVNADELKYEPYKLGTNYVEPVKEISINELRLLYTGELKYFDGHDINILFRNFDDFYQYDFILRYIGVSLNTIMERTNKFNHMQVLTLPELYAKVSSTPHTIALLSNDEILYNNNGSVVKIKVVK